MNAPPGVTPASTRRNDVGGGKDTAVSAALVSRYVSLAKADPALRDVSANKVSRLVRDFLASGLQERELIRYVVGYADPTGETAVRNVMRRARQIRGW
jgi:hypothetical protein